MPVRSAGAGRPIALRVQLARVVTACRPCFSYRDHHVTILEPDLTRVLRTKWRHASSLTDVYHAVRSASPDSNPKLRFKLMIHWRLHLLCTLPLVLRYCTLTARARGRSKVSAVSDSDSHGRIPQAPRQCGGHATSPPPGGGHWCHDS